MIDRLRYEIFHRLWRLWHCRLPALRMFMEWYGYHYDPELYTPEEIAMLTAKFGHEVQYRRWDCKPRPWWHLCCNGNSGGWRTAVCDYLEHKWRDTKYYKDGLIDDEL